MTLSIELYAATHDDLWDDFVDSSANGTIFHKRRFINYHPSERFSDHSLVVMDGHRVVALFPAAEINRDNARVLLSHPGASYGGLVIRARERLSTICEALDVLEAHATDAGFDSVEMRHSPPVLRTSEVDQLDFSLQISGYRRTAEELATFYDLRTYEYDPEMANFIKSFPSGVRRQIRKSARELSARTLETETEIVRFHEILSENLRTKHGKDPVHTVDELIDLRERFQGDVFVLGVFSDLELVGGFCVFAPTPQSLHIFYAALDYSYQIHRPLNLALARLIQLGIEQRRTIVNYGISTTDGGRNVNWSLLRFKEGFGGSGSVRTTWAKDLTNQ